MSDPRDWDLEYDGAAPPLPRQMERNLGAKWRLWSSLVQLFSPRRKGQGERQWAELVQRLLPTGAYLIWFKPRIAWTGTVELPLVLAGVLRIRHSVRDKKLVSSGSGDLYRCPKDDIAKLAKALEALDDERGRLEMLQFPRSEYRYYLRLETLWVVYRDRSRSEPGCPVDESVILGFDTYRFLGNKEGWERRQPISTRVDLEAGCPPELRTSPGREEFPYPTYPALNSLENHIGDIGLVRIADSFRHAEIEIHAVESICSSCKEGISNIALSEYEGMFNEDLSDVGWTVDLVNGSPISRSQVPDGGKWSQRDLREYHKEHIDSASGRPEVAGGEPLGQQSPHSHKTEKWKYHLLLVEHLKWGEQGRPLGLMYDVDVGDEGPPREGAAIALRERTKFKDKEGQLQSFPALLRRTILHEVGHMQGLYHNPSSRGIMQPRKYFSRDFGGSADFVHSDIDALRLGHLPDPWVRPGGVPFGHRYRASAVDIVDLIPTNLEFEELKTEPPWVVTGERPSLTIYSIFRYKGDTELLCPPTDDMSHFGILLKSPSGGQEEIRPVLPPRELTGDTQLIKGDPPITYKIPLGDAMPVLRQAGTYDIKVYLAWVEGDDRNQEQRIYHANGVVKLQVMARAAASSSAHGGED